MVMMMMMIRIHLLYQLVSELVVEVFVPDVELIDYDNWAAYSACIHLHTFVLYESVTEKKKKRRYFHMTAHEYQEENPVSFFVSSFFECHWVFLSLALLPSSASYCYTLMMNEKFVSAWIEYYRNCY